MTMKVFSLGSGDVPLPLDRETGQQYSLAFRRSMHITAAHQPLGEAYDIESSSRGRLKEGTLCFSILQTPRGVLSQD